MLYAHGAWAYTRNNSPVHVAYPCHGLYPAHPQPFIISEWPGAFATY